MKQAHNMEKKILPIGFLIISIAFVITLFVNIVANKEEIVNYKYSNNAYEGKLLGSNEELPKGKVIVKYLDEEGKEIAEPVQLEGTIGTEYTTERKPIDHYMSNGYEPINKIGSYKKEDTEVVYKYMLVSDAVKVEQEGNKITIKVENVLKNREYKLKLEQESTEGYKLSGGKFTLYDIGNDVDPVKATTVNGQATLGVISVANEEDEDLVIKENETPRGYEKALQKDGGSIRLDRLYNNTLKKYELKATSKDKEIELKEDHENSEIILKVKNDIIKTYDLNIRKFVSSIDGENTGRKVEAKVNIDGEITYDEEKKTVQVLDGQRVIYTIRVYNEGNQKMEGTTITESLPKGLKYIEDSQINIDNEWKKENGQLKTDKILGEDIQGIDTSTQTEVDYKEIQLEVEVDEDELEEDGAINNTVTIPVDEREFNKNNNLDEETVYLIHRAKVYDVAIKKFASEINGKTTTRSVTAKLNNLKQIEYDEVDDNSTIKHGQTIIYTIRVYNEGNQSIVGTKITDTIPKGLVFDKNSDINTKFGWKTNGEDIETDYLKGKTIDGVKTYKNELPKFEDLQVEFKLDEDELDEEETSLVNTVKIEKVENETDDLDNEDNDEVLLERTPKTYDLAIKMFASSVDGEETSRNVTVKINDSNQIEYNETRPDKVVKDENRVIYTIRVFNEGNQKVAGTKITDILPEGLKFVENSSINREYGCQQNEGNIETNYLVGKEISATNLRRNIAPGYIELKIECEVVEDLTDDSVTKITNRVILEKLDNETDVADNQDTDTLNLSRRPKTYNLNLKKFASKIDGINTGRSVEVSLTDDNQIKYVETKPEKTVKEGQKIIYTLRVYNEGNQSLNGTKITEDLPKGLKYVEDSNTNSTYNWKLVNGKVETNYLEGQTIEGVRTEKGQVPNYKEIFIELEVTRKDIGKKEYTIVNTANLSKHELETNIEDNEAQDTVFLEKAPIYDLAVKKIASQVNGKDTGRKIEVSVNDQDEIVYTKTTTEVKVKDNQKIIYKYRIFNNGNTPIEGTQIADKIPEGLTYLPDSPINQQYGWTENEGVITSQFAVGKTINVYDKTKINSINYIDVEIEFQVNGQTVNENNLIVNTAKIDKNENEEKDDEGNNEDTETVIYYEVEKIYDLAMKKFVYSLDNKKLEKEITASINENKKIVYSNDNTKTNVNKGQVVVYTLRIFNEGNQDMAGKIVSDSIPKGLKYKEDSKINEQYNWEVKDGEVVTNYLIGKTIKGFDIEEGETPKYEELQIEFEVTDEEVTVNEEITNIAKIEVDENEKDIDDNNDECTVILIPEKQKVFDLSMDKFLYSVDGKEVKIQNDEIYKVCNNQKLVYTLRIYNLGDGEALGREVIENLPDGLEYIPDSKINEKNEWKMYKKEDDGSLTETKNVKEAEFLKTDYLATQTIAGYEVENNETPRYKDVQVEVIVKEDNIKTENRTITNTAKIEKNVLEPNSDNDEDTYTVKVKYFDLNVTKYIESITIKDDTGETVTEVGLAKKGQIVKKEVEKRKINSTQVYVTYGLRVKNIGEIAGYATQITDYIPENFELVDEENKWKIDGNTVTTDYLKNQIIQPNEYKTIKLTFKWDLKNGNLGERNNKAIISSYKNDYTAKDRTPDKDNEEKFIISIRTGTVFELSVLVMIIILTIIAIAIGIKIKRQDKIK